MDIQYKIACITPIEHIEGVEENLLNLGFVDFLHTYNKVKLHKFLVEQKHNLIFCNPNQQRFVIDKELLENTNIKYIVTASTGTNHIDLDYCNVNNIKVTSITKDYNLLEKITSTSELAFILMMNLIRHVPEGLKRVENYDWTYISGRQLNQMKVGIVGYGRLGKMMYNYCKSFGADVYVYDPYKKLEGINQLYSLEELFDFSDIVSLHVHLNDKTRYMINKSILSKTNNTYLVNTSRGDIVNEQDIIDSLDSGNLLGYATDVISDELGDVRNSELIKVFNKKKHNLIITPHQGGSTLDAMNLAYNGVIDKFKATK